MTERQRVSKGMLSHTLRNKRDLVSEQANYYAKRNQLEELFIECVEEVRRDIHKRKGPSIGLHGDLTGILDDTAKKANFTATDKRKVLDLLLANENVLLFLYEKLFPRPIASQPVPDQVARHVPSHRS
jgi:hypothetical protein